MTSVATPIHPPQRQHTHTHTHTHLFPHVVSVLAHREHDQEECEDGQDQEGRQRRDRWHFELVVKFVYIVKQDSEGNACQK